MPLIRWGHLFEHTGHDVRIVKLDETHVVLECLECACSIIEETNEEGVTSYGGRS